MKNIFLLGALFQLLCLPVMARIYYHGYYKGNEAFTTIDRIANMTDPPATCDELMSSQWMPFVADASLLNTTVASYCEGGGCSWENRNSTNIDKLMFQDNQTMTVAGVEGGKTSLAGILVWEKSDSVLRAPGLSVMSSILGTPPQPVASCYPWLPAHELECADPFNSKQRSKQRISAASTIYCEHSTVVDF